MPRELKITTKIVKDILSDRSPKLKKEHRETPIHWFVDKLRNEKIFVPSDDYQRLFNPTMKQFLGIMNAINKNFMNQSITLTDIKKQIEFLTEKVKYLTDNVEIDSHLNNIKYYENLYQNGNGYHYTLDDGQHRCNYIMMFYWASQSEEIDIDLLAQFLSIELSTFFVWGVPLKDIVDLFQSINTTRPVNTDGKIWGEVTDFNDELKDLAKSPMNLNLFDNSGGVERDRTNYKLWFNVLKICGGYEGIHKSTAVKGRAMIDFIRSECKLSDYQVILDMYPQFVRIFNMLKNVSGQYTIFNVFFVIHRVHLNKNIVLDDENVVELVYICNHQIHAQTVNLDRYKEVIGLTNKYFYEFLERTSITT